MGLPFPSGGGSSEQDTFYSIGKLVNGLSQYAGEIASAITASVTTIGAHRLGRQRRLDKLRDDILAEVRKENADLKEEMKACTEDRQVLAVVTMGVKLLVPEMQRLDRNNPILTQVSNAFAALPDSREDFTALLAKLNSEPGTIHGKSRPEVGE